MSFHFLIAAMIGLVIGKHVFAARYNPRIRQKAAPES